MLGLSTSHLKLGSVFQARGDSATAQAEYRTALRLRETLLESQPDNVEILERVLDVQSTLAELQRQLGDDAGAIETFERAKVVIEKMVARDPTNTTWKRQHANLLADLGFALLESGAFANGLAQLEVAIRIQDELALRDAKNTSWQFDLSRSYTRAGDGDMYLGATDAGIAKYERALEIRRKLSTVEPASAPYRRAVAFSFSKLGNAYVAKADPARAIESHEQALALRQKLVADSPAQSGFRNELASSEVTLGKLLAARDAKRSSELIAAGLERARKLVAADPINNEWKETVTQALLARADAARVTADRAGRRDALIEALGLAEAAAANAKQNAKWPGFLAEIHAGLAELATDPNSMAAEWKAVRDQLEPLERSKRLSAVRKFLLDRARATR